MRWTLPITNVCNFLAYSVLVTNTAASGQEVLSWTFGSFWCVRQEMSFCETSQFFRLRSVGFQRNIKQETRYDVSLKLQETGCSLSGAAEYVRFLLAMTTKLPKIFVYIKVTSCPNAVYRCKIQYTTTGSGLSAAAAASGDRVILCCY